MNFHECLVCGSKMNRTHGGFWKCKASDLKRCVNTRQFVTDKGNIGFRRPSRGMVVMGILVTEQAETPVGCLVPFRERKA